MKPTSASAGDSPVLDAVCIGETMVAFVGLPGETTYEAAPAGAESNVAVAMARLGLRVAWVSRLGDDPLADLIESTVGGAGVRLEVVRDTTSPTGALTKHLGPSGAAIQYYRSQSAARLLSRLDLERMDPAHWIHVTGITPALSASAADLVEAVVEGEGTSGARVSFDVNHRPVLWADDATAADTMRSLAQRADVVFLGDDEAERLFGTSDPDGVARELLRRDGQEIVLKRGPGPVTVITAEQQVSETVPPVAVVDVVGAGDAFAAGYLAGHRLGWDARTRLRLGCFVASQVLGVPGDIVPPFRPDELAALSPDWLAARWGEDPLSD